MQLLTPPTDNLYKFICISGLALLLYANYTNRQTRQDYFEKSIEALASIDSADKLHSAATESIIRELKSIRTGAEMEAFRLKERMHYDSNEHRYKLPRPALMNKLAKFEMDMAAYDELMALYPKLQYLGLALFVTGLFFWYTKVQKYQDKALAEEGGSKKQVSKFTPVPTKRNFKDRL